MITLSSIHREEKKLHLEESVLFGVLLAIVGGLLDAYTFVGRGGVMANAQTGNMVFLAVSLSKGEWRQTLEYIIPIFAFVAGAIIADLIKHEPPRLLIADWVRKILILEAIILFFVGFIPNTTSDMVVNSIISFVASIQTSSFRKLANNAYASVMCTGNLRFASEQALRAIQKKDRQSAINSIRFLIIIFSFIFGAVLGGILTFTIGAKAVWGSVIVLVLAILLYSVNQRNKKNHLNLAS